MKATSLFGCLQLISIQSSMASTLPIFWNTPEWRPIFSVTLYSMGVASHEWATLTGGLNEASVEIKSRKKVHPSEWEIKIDFLKSIFKLIFAMLGRYFKWQANISLGFHSNGDVKLGYLSSLWFCPLRISGGTTCRVDLTVTFVLINYILLIIYIYLWRMLRSRTNSCQNGEGIVFTGLSSNPLDLWQNSVKRISTATASHPPPPSPLFAHPSLPSRKEKRVVISSNEIFLQWKKY